MAFWRFLPQVQIILMIVLGGVEDHSLSDLCSRMIAHLQQFAKDFDGGVAFFGVVEPDGGEILGTDVDALAVGLFEVVDLEEILD